MSRFLLALGAAAFAVSAPALADKEGKGGGEKGGKGDQSIKADHGNGGGKAMRQADHGGRDNDKASRGHDRKDFARGRGDDGPVRMVDRVLDRSDRKLDRDDRARFVTRKFGDVFDHGRGFNGCPPGLDKKDNGCLPPGQAKKFLGARLQTGFANSLLPYQYRSWYRDDDDHFFRSGDGFIYRVNRSNDLVDGLIPLFGGGDYYAMGDQWPDPYNFYNVPYQYRNYYADSADYRYRYGDGAIYRINSGSGVVDGIVALLAGDLGVGQQLPLGYDAYNVPFQYRDRYFDSADNWYRYNDGYIYQVDPKTRLISAVIDAIV